MTLLTPLSSYLDVHCARAEVAEAVLALAGACAEIAALVRVATLGDLHGEAGGTNVQDEAQQKLDVLADDVIGCAMRRCGAVAGYASEEQAEIRVTGRTGGVLVLFDPLDGSSNIDVNVTIGTIFSILAAPAGGTPTTQDFLQAGREQLAAGYAVYGPQTELVLTVGEAVVAFTLDGESEWRLTRDALAVPPETAEFAINMSNQRHWSPAVQTYVADCLQGREGPRGKDFNMRWVGSMVADVHRILIRGGVFLYPWDARQPGRAGKLRLMYEGAPMALLIERAGGATSDGRVSLLDVMPDGLHDRVSVVLGAADEVRRATGAV